MSLLEWITFICAAMAFFLNIYVIIIVIRSKSKSMGTYKFLLLFYMAIAAVYSGSQALLLPTFYCSELGFLFYQTTNLLPRFLDTVLIVIFGSCYSQIIICVAVSFLYRYFSVCQTHLMVWFQKGLNLYILIGICATVQLYLTTCVALIAPTSSSDAIFKSIMNQKEGVDIIKITYLGGPLLDKKGHINIYLPLVLISMSSVIVLACGLIIYCILKIVKQFHALAAVSQTNMKQHKRLFMLLIMQTLFPLVCNFSPTLIVSVLTFTGLDIGNLIQFPAVAMSFASVAEPLMVAYFVEEYKRTVKRHLYCGRRPLAPSKISITNVPRISIA